MNCPLTVAELIIDNTKVPVFWKDAERRYLGVSRAFLDFFGLADDKSIVGRTSEEAWLVSNVGKCVESDEHVLSGGRVANEQHTFVINGEEKLTLRFDCKPCEMHVIGKPKKGRRS